MAGAHAILAIGLLVSAQGAAEANNGAAETVSSEVEVTFAGDEVVEVPDGEEVEVTFAEEVDLDGFAELPPLPEYEEAAWLSVLPLLCVALLAWNVRWKRGPRRHARKS